MLACLEKESHRLHLLMKIRQQTEHPHAYKESDQEKPLKSSPPFGYSMIDDMYLFSFLIEHIRLLPEQLQAASRTPKIARFLPQN
jgi:hypothetical protein